MNTAEAQLQGALAAVQGHPEDAGRLISALELARTTRQLPAFQWLAEVAYGRHDSHPQIQFQLGVSHEFFGDVATAEVYYRRAVAFQAGPAAQLALARNLIYQEKAAQAEPFLLACEGHLEADWPSLWQALAAVYDRAGLPTEAARCRSRHPRQGPPPVPSHVPASFPQHAATRSPREKRIKPDRAVRVLGVVLALLLIGAGILFALALQSVSSRSPAKLWVANGLGVPYTVTIDGESRKISAWSARSFAVPPGVHTLNVEGEGVHIPEQRFELPEQPGCYVLNPDQIAIIEKNSTLYSQKVYDEGEVEPELSYQIGELLTSYQGIHYPFKPLPDEVRLPLGKLEDTRTSLTVLEGGSLSAYIDFLADHEIDAMPFFRRWVSVQPGELDVLEMVGGNTPSAYFVKMAQPHLAARPVRALWHRYYQVHRAASEPHYDLQSQYQRWLEESPDDAVLQYLLAEVTPEPETSRKLLLQAAQGSPPVAQAFEALARRHLVRGEYEDALAFAEKGVAIKPDYFGMQHEAYAGLGNWRPILQRAKVAAKENPKDLETVGDLMAFQLLAGQDVAAARVRKEYELAVREELEAESLWLDTLAYLDALEAYFKGDEADFARAAAKIDRPSWQFDAAVTRNQAATALELLPSTNHDPFSYYLLVYALAERTGDRDIAAKAWEMALAERGEPRPGEDVLYDLLVAPQVPSEEELLALDLLPEEKRFVVLALAARHVEDRADLQALGRRFNTWRSFPYLLVERLLDPKAVFTPAQVEAAGEKIEDALEEAPPIEPLEPEEPREPQPEPEPAGFEEVAGSSS